MIKIIKGHCSKRPGILEYRSPDGDDWTPAAYSDSKGTIPKVFDCEHDAIDCQIDIVIQLHYLVMAGEMELTGFPTPHDFRYVFVDKVPKVYDKPVGNTSAADFLINRIKSKL